MPELPEVEITRRSLVDRIVCARVQTVRLGKPLRWPLGIQPSVLQGLRVTGLRRRGKYLLLDLDAGVLLLHLGMSGSLSFDPVAPQPGPHDHFDLVTDLGVLRLHDPRRFGAVVWAPDMEAPVVHKLLGRLGPEPWDELGRPFDAQLFWTALRASRGQAIKPLLLQGRAVVGVGNIYASEVLFRAGIHPAVPACSLSRPRALRLRNEVCAVLSEAVNLGGSTLRDFRDAHGAEGLFQTQVRVYGREGQPCDVCGGKIRKTTQGQRSTWWCVACQRR